MSYKLTNSKGNTYYLNSKDVTLKSTGRVQTIYFSQKTLDQLDVTYLQIKVIENQRQDYQY